ncbi:MAG: hypothetical protein H6729_13970 [Deltaproteobacteria bacterium]|nr:hypothetical protein [Deltaproteobacteria bacterium]
MTFLAVAVLCGWSVVAEAQSETLGFPLGEKSRLHTKLDLGVAFDSNPSRLDKSDPGARGDWRGLIRPGLSVAVPGSEFSLELRSGLTINQFFGVNEGAQTTFGASVGLGLRAGSERSRLAFSVNDSLVRTPMVLDEVGTVAFDERRFKQWSNQGVAKISLRPGGGALEFNLGYTNGMSFYDNLPWSMSHGALIEARWRFLPKTVAFFTSNFSFFSSKREVANNTLKSTPYTAEVGLSSAITARMSATVQAGIGDALTWQDGYFSSLADSNSRTMIGGVQLGYAFSQALRASVGYRRQVVPVILLNNYIGDAVDLSGTIAPSMRLQFRLYAKYEHRGYGVGRNVHALTGDARVDYWFFDFLSGGLGYRLLLQRPSNPSASAQAGYFLESFARQQVFMNVGLRY